MDAKTHDPARGKVDVQRFGLRRYLESLKGTDELEIVEGPTDLADVAAKLAGSEKAVWFKNAGGAELVGNVVASRSRLALAVGVEPKNLVYPARRRLSRLPRPMRPCMK